MLVDRMHLGGPASAEAPLPRLINLATRLLKIRLFGKAAWTQLPFTPPTLEPEAEVEFGPFHSPMSGCGIKSDTNLTDNP